jgi:3-oxoacyl-[acyl-carrier-protein] synthase II
MRSGAERFGQIDRERYHRRERAQLGAVVEGASVTRWLPAIKARRMSRPSRFAVAAALAAVAERERQAAVDWSSAATVLGTCFGPSAYTEGMLRQVHEEGPQGASPVLFIESVANAPAAQIALRFKSHGANVTVTQREASGLLATREAAQAVARGECSCAFTGSVDELDPLLHSVLDRYGALARSRGSCRESSRPFAADRNGFVAGEGAVVAVLERESMAPPQPLARLVGSVAAFDPTASQTSWGSGGEALSEILVQGLQRIGCHPSSIDLVVSGASGSRAGDALEAEVLRRVWPAALPAVLTPKSVAGEVSGTLLAAGVLACAGHDLGPGLGAPEVRAALDPLLRLPEVPRAVPGARRVLVSALAAGGAAAWLVLERCRG